MARDGNTILAGLWLFIAGLTGPQSLTKASYFHGTLRKPYGAAIAFIADAAHRSSPELGQGANVALLDAVALATTLTRKDPLPEYARLRRWHLRSYQMLSAVLTPMYQSHSRILLPLRDHILAPMGRFAPVRASLTRLVSGNLRPPLASTAFP